MKNITIEMVEEIREEVVRVNKYRAIWDKTVEMFPDYKDREYSRDILSAIEEQIGDCLSSLDTMLWEAFEEWSGIMALRDEGLSPWDDTRDAYYEREDEIREQHEDIAGVCRYLIGIDGEVDENMSSVPVDFMNEFIAEFGIFEMDNEDVRIL